MIILTIMVQEMRREMRDIRFNMKERTMLFSFMVEESRTCPNDINSYDLKQNLPFEK